MRDFEKDMATKSDVRTVRRDQVMVAGTVICTIVLSGVMKKLQ